MSTNPTVLSKQLNMINTYLIATTATTTTTTTTFIDEIEGRAREIALSRIFKELDLKNLSLTSLHCEATFNVYVLSLTLV